MKSQTVTRPVRQRKNPVKDDEKIQYLRKLIIDLNAELKTEREHSRQQADRIAELTRNQQVLFGMEQQKTLPIVSDNATGGGVGLLEYPSKNA